MSKKIKIPLTKRCVELFKAFETNEEVILHSLQVNKVALYVAEKLQKDKKKLNLDLIDKASLLHDMAKNKSKSIKGHHSEIAYHNLIVEYPEVAKIVRSHRTIAILGNKSKPKTWEEKIVYYANQIVNGDQIVLLEQKLRHNIEKHRKSKNKRLKAYEKTYQIEKKILKTLDITPGDLVSLNEKPFIYSVKTFLPNKICIE